MSPARRSHVPLLVLLVAGVLLAGMLPASAATARSLSITVSTSTPTVSSTVTVSGTLSRSTKGAPVTVQRLSGTRWVTAKATRTTSTKGTWSAKVTAPSASGTLKLRAVAKAIKNRKAATSRTVALDVRRTVTVTATASPSRITVGDPVTVSGAAAPFVAGTTVTIQTGGGTRVSTTTVGNDGTYRATVTPTSVGTATYRAVVAGRTGYATATSPTRSVTVDAKPVQPVISTSSLDPGQTGTAYAARLRTAGDQPGTWSVDSLPAGLLLTPTTGVIDGTPTTPGTTTSTFTFVHSNGLSAQKALDLTIRRTPSITTTSLPATSRGATYDVQLDSTEPGTWSIVSGSLPRGLSLSTSGRITGTVTAPTLDSFPVDVRMTGSTSALRSPTVRLTVDVRTHVATANLPAATVRQPYTVQLRTNGTISGTWESVSQLPAGLSLSGDGVLSGTPTASQPDQLFTVRYRTANPAVQEDSRNLTLRVENVMPTTPSTTQVSSGSEYACRVLSTDSTLWCWGYDFKGNLGIGNNSFQNVYFLTPQKVGQASTWRSVSTGGYYTTCATRTDDTLWCWGYNNDGQVGDGLGSQANAPRQVGTARPWASVSVGELTSCAIARAGSLWCWGSNTNDALGGAPTNYAGGSTVPALVDGGSWTSVSVGSGVSCAVKTDASLWCWGRGIGSVPTKVDSASWRSVSAGYGTLCGVRTDDTLWCWGDNRAGQVGDGTTTRRATPVQIGSDRTWRSVSTGGANRGQTTCAVADDGSAWCWGSGDFGQVGDGTGTSRTTPTRLDATASWSSVSVGGSTVCGVKNDGSQRCWGVGGYGELGNGTRQPQSLTPVPVG